MRSPMDEDTSPRLLGLGVWTFSSVTVLVWRRFGWLGLVVDRTFWAGEHHGRG